MLSMVLRWRPLTRIRPSARRVLAVLLAAATVAGPARAQVGSSNYSSIVIDAASGNVLSAVNPDDARFPASLTKMMTLYMLFEALRDRRVSLNQYVPVSPNAASMSPTKLGLVPGSLITVEQAILGLVTKSANDAAAALGEMLGGDEDRFAQMMTLRARGLGMTRTMFQNASGLPDWNQYTTARDMAILGRRLIQDFPGFYHYFSTPSFVYGGRVIFNHQRLLQTYAGADGLKTGYIDASGYNVTTSALRGETRLVGVVMGAASGAERDRHMAALLDQGFDRMGVSPLLARREPGFRMPSLIASANAAPGLAPVAPRLRNAQAVPSRAMGRPAARIERDDDARPSLARGAFTRPAFNRTPLNRPVAMRPMAEPRAAQSAPTLQQVRNAPPARLQQPVLRPAGQAARRYPG